VILVVRIDAHHRAGLGREDGVDGVDAPVDAVEVGVDHKALTLVQLHLHHHKHRQHHNSILLILLVVTMMTTILPHHDHRCVLITILPHHDHRFALSDYASLPP
jgi:hypothetical protein